MRRTTTVADNGFDYSQIGRNITVGDRTNLIITRSERDRTDGITIGAPVGCLVAVQFNFTGNVCSRLKNLLDTPVYVTNTGDTGLEVSGRCRATPVVLNGFNQRQKCRHDQSCIGTFTITFGFCIGNVVIKVLTSVGLFVVPTGTRAHIYKPVIVCVDTIDRVGCRDKRGRCSCYFINR